MRVWNISHLTNAQTAALTIQGKRCAPGKHVEVDQITKKEQNLVGVYLHIGSHIPVGSKSPDAEPLTRDECREHLLALSTAKLVGMAKAVSPALSDDLSSKSKFWLASKIVMAIFSPDFDVDPQLFLWTNRWVKVGSGYREK